MNPAASPPLTGDTVRCILQAIESADHIRETLEPLGNVDAATALEQVLLMAPRDRQRYTLTTTSDPDGAYFMEGPEDHWVVYLHTDDTPEEQAKYALAVIGTTSAGEPALEGPFDPKKRRQITLAGLIWRHVALGTFPHIEIGDALQ